MNEFDSMDQLLNHVASNTSIPLDDLQVRRSYGFNHHWMISAGTWDIAMVYIEDSGRFYFEYV